MKIQEIASETHPHGSVLPIHLFPVFSHKERDCSDSNPGHWLFQESFFFCRVRKIGDATRTECIYIETVVDRDSGVAFAKVYPARNAMNSVDLLTSRVAPFFEGRRISIQEIHTRKTNDYCGLPHKHPHETFLAASHILHLGTDEHGKPYNYLCLQFYELLLKEFFPLAHRSHFHQSLSEIQNEPDAFANAYNATQIKRRGNS
jgi:hypothetical protein